MVLLLRAEQYSVGYTPVARKGFITGSWLSLRTRGAGDLRGLTVGGIIMVVVLVDISRLCVAGLGVAINVSFLCKSTVVVLSSCGSHAFTRIFRKIRSLGVLHACVFRAFFLGTPSAVD